MSTPAEAAASAPSSRLPGNARLFLFFRIFFNCRFYYPVYTVLFLDFGLNLDQFATLNAVWAAAIVLMEVPSGALADQVGRRTLVVGSALLMVVEMLILCLLPIRGGAALFWFFVLNRLVSGASEAAASGADEALVYDSLPAGERDSIWAALQTRLIRWQSLFQILTTLTGAAVYDPGVMTKVAGWFGSTRVFVQDETLRYPLWLTLATAVACFLTARQFGEPAGETQSRRFSVQALVESFRAVLRTGSWILRTPAPLILILTGLLFDSSMRLFYTVGSQYYRVIDIPTAFNGWIGAAACLMGFFTAAVLSRMAGRFSPQANFRIVGLLILLGFGGMALAWSWWGLLFAVPFWFAMRALHFFLSQYLNKLIPPADRATALSFRGLAMNTGYGTVMKLFGWQTVFLGSRLHTTDTDAVFTRALTWWPWIFAAALMLLWPWLGRLRTIATPAQAKA